jgi:GntR family transcriptional regulator, transcriptional repressor for pyruvate dehydrogenase complex
MRFHKRGDVIADSIKQWIVKDKLRPGDRLPAEKQLAEKYQVGKASVREALKSLEVQGLIRTSTGPTGGPAIAEVTETRILNHLQSYFFFKDLTATDVYEVRRSLEPTLAGHIAEIATPALLDQLEENVEASRAHIETREDWQRQQQVHIRFHDLLASGGSNPLLCMHCKFINLTIRNIVRSREAPNQLELIRSNGVWHEKIFNAIRARDPRTAEDLMRDHIVEIDNAYKVTNPVLHSHLHLETQDPDRLNALPSLS